MRAKSLATTFDDGDDGDREGFVAPWRGPVLAVEDEVLILVDDGRAAGVVSAITEKVDKEVPNGFTGGEGDGVFDMDKHHG